MAVEVKIKNVNVGVGDTVRVVQRIKEARRERNQAFEGVVIAIRGRGNGRSLVIRRIGVGNVGIEKIFPVASPLIVEAKVIKRGLAGIRKSKLYYLRGKPIREIGKIYQRASRKENK